MKKGWGRNRSFAERAGGGRGGTGRLAIEPLITNNDCLGVAIREGAGDTQRDLLFIFGIFSFYKIGVPRSGVNRARCGTYIKKDEVHTPSVIIPNIIDLSRAQKLREVTRAW